MIRTVFKPDSNVVNFPIPDKYVGKEIEIMIFPLNEISVIKTETKDMDNVDLSFGAWADMDKSTEEICVEIKSSRMFRKKDLML
jgi:hypothetical protein